MPIEVRPLTLDEYDDLEEADRIAFAQDARKDGDPESWARAEFDRTRGAFDDGRLVGASRNYSFELTVPGGGLLPAAAVSWVSVMPTHRRRGILTKMIGALHDDARERGEPVAILTASESVIYGRFGYGIATWRLGISLERVHARFARAPRDTGRIRYLSEDESLKVLPPVYDAARRQRAGMVTRPDFWWPEVYHYMADQVAPSFRVVHEDGNGYVDGFALYGVRGDWQNGLAGKRLVVMDLVSTTPSAHEALWQFLIGVDLVDTIVAVNLPIDEPLRFMLTDPRRVRTDYVNDGLWLCMLDEVAALSARSYAVDGSLAFEVHRPDGSVGRFLLDAGRDGAACTPANASADLVLGTSELSASYLGGVSFASLRDAGRVEEVSAGAIARADALFATPVAPAMTTNF